MHVFNPFAQRLKSCDQIFEAVEAIKLDLRVMGWDGMDWMDMAQYRDQ
jgi:hypothetical protein